MTSEVFQTDAEYVLGTYDRYPILLTSGDGVYVTDANGKTYLDFLSGIGVNALGYAHPKLTAAITEQVRKGLLHTSNLFHNEWQSKLARMLCDISGFDKAFIANSGTEAWEGALKFARLHSRTKKSHLVPPTRFLAMTNSFHGRTFGSISTTGQAKYREPFAPLLPDIDFVRFNDVSDLVRKWDDSVAAVCFETIQGEGGVVPISPEFLSAARQLTDSTGALLIADEIQCGMGRTGKWFAFQHYDVTPDIVTIAKPLAGGIPCAAVLMSQSVADCVTPGIHGTTFGGGPLACAAAVAALHIMEEEQLLARAADIGTYISGKMREMQSRVDAIVDVRGIGLMIGVELSSGSLAKSAASEMLRRGIIINRTHDTVLRFLPPYIIEHHHADAMLSALEEVLIEQSKSELASVEQSVQRG